MRRCVLNETHSRDSIKGCIIKSQQEVSCTLIEDNGKNIFNASKELKEDLLHKHIIERCDRL